MTTNQIKAAAIQISQAEVCNTIELARLVRQHFAKMGFIICDKRRRQIDALVVQVKTGQI